MRGAITDELLEVKGLQATHARELPRLPRPVAVDFDFAFLAEEIGASKPEPDMFHAALEHTGASAAEIIHVGDDPVHDIQGAQQVGMRTIWVNLRNKDWPGGLTADQEIRTLKDLPDAISQIAADTRREPGV